MADPNAVPPGRHDAPPPAADAPPGRRGSTPLLWLVLLLALLAFGWFVYEQRTGDATAPEALPPPVDIGDATDAAAERERAADDARRAARERAADAGAAPPAAPDAEPELRTRVQPDYPPSAYRDQVEGTVLVGIQVRADGRVGEVDVVRHSGSRELDRAAVDAVKQWTFEPAVRGGQRVEARVEVPVTFRIDEPR